MFGSKPDILQILLFIIYQIIFMFEAKPSKDFFIVSRLVGQITTLKLEGKTNVTQSIQTDIDKLDSKQLADIQGRFPDVVIFRTQDIQATSQPVTLIISSAFARQDSSYNSLYRSK